MNHRKIYDNITNKSKSENRKRLNKTNEKYIYYECHHILPKCLGGSNDKENLVLLTAREHYIAHKLLTYIYPENTKIIYAFHLMTCFNKNKEYVSSKDYELARSLRSNKSLSKETKEKLSIKSSGKNNGMFKNGEKISGEKNGMFGKHHTEKSIEKIKNSKRGETYWIKINNLNNIKKLRIETGKKYIHFEKQCPHCNLIGKGPNMTRYHFNNCKYKNND